VSLSHHPEPTARACRLTPPQGGGERTLTREFGLSFVICNLFGNWKLEIGNLLCILMSKITTHSSTETQKLGIKIAGQITGPAVFGLVGELGAGKTHLTQGIAQGLNIKKHLTSPTFVLLKVYPVAKNKKGIKNLIHLDCYRLSHPEELSALGWQEFLDKKESVIVVEWADKIKGIMPADTVWIALEQGRGETERIIEFKN